MCTSKQEVLKLFIDVEAFDEVKGNTGDVLLISFRGHVDCELFKGVIEKNGVDTQIQYHGKQRTLSARYIVNGEDKTGSKCHIFIENNGVINENGQIVTTPRIITDSKELAWLETAELSGEVESGANGLIIHIYKA